MRRGADCDELREYLEDTPRQRECARVFWELQLRRDAKGNFARHLAELIPKVLLDRVPAFDHVVAYNTGMGAPWVCAELARTLGLSEDCVLAADGLDMDVLVDETGKPALIDAWARMQGRHTVGDVEGAAAAVDAMEGRESDGVLILAMNICNRVESLAAVADSFVEALSVNDTLVVVQEQFYAHEEMPIFLFHHLLETQRLRFEVVERNVALGLSLYTVAVIRRCRPRPGAGMEYRNSRLVPPVDTTKHNKLLGAAMAKRDAELVSIIYNFSTFGATPPYPSADCQRAHGGPTGSPRRSSWRRYGACGPRRFTRTASGRGRTGATPARRS